MKKLVKKHKVGGRNKQGLSELRVLLAIMDSTIKIGTNEKSPHTNLPYIQTHQLKDKLGITNVYPFLTRLRENPLEFIEQKNDGRDTCYCMVKDWKTSKILKKIVDRYYNHLFTTLPEGPVYKIITKYYSDKKTNDFIKGCEWVGELIAFHLYRDNTPDILNNEALFNTLSKVLNNFLYNPNPKRLEFFGLKSAFILGRILDNPRTSIRDKIMASYFYKIINP